MSSSPPLQILADNGRSTYISVAILLGILILFPVSFVLILLISRNTISIVSAIMLFLLILAFVMVIFLSIYLVLYNYLLPINPYVSQKTS